MQRLEVSCAVRFIYTSLGAKGLRIFTVYINLFQSVKSMGNAYHTARPKPSATAWRHHLLAAGTAFVAYWRSVRSLSSVQPIQCCPALYHTSPRTNVIPAYITGLIRQKTSQDSRLTEVLTRSWTTANVMRHSGTHSLIYSTKLTKDTLRYSVLTL